MDAKEEVKTMVSSQPETQLNIVDVKQYSSPDDLETFYVKLTDLLDSSGFTLIFNVRETSLDLYLFYMEVTRRGGYHQVGKQKKWGEIVSALKLEGNNAKLCAQVEKLYANLLYKFEKFYFYRFPASQTATASSKGSAKRKQSSATSISQLMDDGDYVTAAKIYKDYPMKMTAMAPVLLPAPSNDKEKKKKRGKPTGQSGYQIFLKQECARLKASRQDIDGKTVLRMAVDGWNKMSDIDKQPYLDESKKMKEQKKEAMMIDKEQKRNEDLKKDEKKEAMTIDKKQKSTEDLKKDEKKEAMIIEKKQKSTEDLKNDEKKEAMVIDKKQKSSEDVEGDEKKGNVCCGDYYCVTLQPQANDGDLVNNAAVDLAFKMTEKTSKDPFFPFDLEAYRSVDLLTGIATGEPN